MQGGNVFSSAMKSVHQGERSSESFHEIPFGTTCSLSVCFEQLPNLKSDFQKVQIMYSNKVKKKKYGKK